MPIKPENKDLYPSNWPEISRRIRVVRANNHCEACGLKNYMIIKRLPLGQYRTPGAQEWDMIYSRIRNQHSNMTESLKHFGFTKVILTTAHLNHNPENCSDNNLMALCQRCHNIYDRAHRNETMRTTRKKGQLELQFI